MSAPDPIKLREMVVNSAYYAQAKKVLFELAILPEIVKLDLPVVVDLNPDFLVPKEVYEKYRGCTMEIASEFEDHFSLGEMVVSRSCLLSFMAKLNRISGPAIYFSLGAYARKEKKEELEPGVREWVFPQLEVEILAPCQFSSPTLLDLLFLLQTELFVRMGLRGRLRFRLNDHDDFVRLISGLTLTRQRHVRKLMDELETSRAEEKDVLVALNKIMELTPNNLHAQFKKWANTPYTTDPRYPRALWSPTLVGGHLTYEHEVFETDYFTTTGVQFTEVVGGGDFTPLARRFGLSNDQKAIGFAVGLLRLETAGKSE